jgi:putative transposase
MSLAETVMNVQTGHHRGESSARLVQHSEIARTLGVNVMTLHRWRKAPPGLQPALVAPHEASRPDRTRGGGDQIAELQLENSRLRRLLTDLLLEKIKIEEAAQSQKSSREGTRRAFRY